MRVGVAAVAMVLVAEAAVWLLRPRRAADRAGARLARATTSPQPQIDRGRAYSDGQLWLLLAARGRPGRRAGHAGARPAGRGRAAASSGWRPARCSGRRRRAPGCRVALGRRCRCRPASRRTSARSTTASRPSRSAPGSPTPASRRRSARCWRPAGGGAADRPGAPLRAALVAARERRRGRDRRRLRLAGPGGAGAALQQVHAAARRQQGSRRGARARQAGRAWTSARCTGSTRAAGCAR